MGQLQGPAETNTVRTVPGSLHGPQAPVQPPPGPGLAGRALRSFVDANWRASAGVDRWALAHGRTEGLLQYPLRLVALLRPGMRVIDLGGGKWPSIPPERKRELGLRVIGVDISRQELDRAPAGSYDEAVCASAEGFQLPDPADLVISRALAEHVADPEAMFRRVHGALRRGGQTLHFVPNRHALLAVLNRLLPHRTKRRLLHTIYPLSSESQGFEAFYRRCTPGAILRTCREIGFRDVTVTPHFASNYFVALLPAHLAMVGWQLAMQGLGADELCESFLVQARK